MKTSFLTIIFILISSIAVFSQGLKIKVPTYTNVIESDEGYLLTGLIVDGDTFPHVKMHRVLIYPKRKFKTRRQHRRYNRLVYNVKKVYPYAVLIGNYYAEIVRDLQYIPNKRDQKKYLKRKEKELRGEYEGTLVDLTFTQGRLLIKLVDRETSHSTFDVVREFKGGVSAVFWQSLALLFGTNLKTEYDPSIEDKMIEEIIAQIQNGQI